MMTEVLGETHDAPAKTRVEKVNMNLLLTLSPINEILNSKDDNVKKQGRDTVQPTFAVAATRQDISLEAFTGELHRLALFLGSLDSSLDFSPKLPYDAVKPGDT